MVVIVHNDKVVIAKLNNFPTYIQHLHWNVSIDLEDWRVLKVRGNYVLLEHLLVEITSQKIAKGEVWKA